MRTLMVRDTGARRGTTLYELVFALALFGIVAAAMLRVLDRQARFHEGVTRVLESRVQLIGTHEAVAAEVRGAASAAGDIERVTDSSLVYRSLIGSGIICAVTPTGADLAPERLAAGHVLTHFASSPQPGDSVWMFSEGASPSSLDDRWIATSIAAASRAAGACAGTPFLDPVRDAAATGWRLTLAGPSPLPDVAAGSALRVTRRARFALYRASTGETALGFTEWNASTGAWNVIQPVAGPFVPFNRASPSAGGVAFTAWDSTGGAISSGVAAPPIARLGITARAPSRGSIRMDGLARGLRVDSLASTTALRNKP